MTLEASTKIQPTPTSAGRAAAETELAAAWKHWRFAFAHKNKEGVAAALAEVVRLDHVLALDRLDAYSMALTRHAGQRAEAGDTSEALLLSRAAVELSPGLPFAHLGLAKVSHLADAGNVGRSLGELWKGMRGFVADPRYLRPLLGDLALAVLAALVVTAMVVTAVLFLRRARYFFHDFHHLLPRLIARWQSTAAASLLLTLPLVFHLGLVPALLGLFAAVGLYLNGRERWVLAVLISALGLIPVLGRQIAAQGSFAGTVAEDVQKLEQGGYDQGLAVSRLEERAGSGEAGFPELAALGRYQLEREQLESAVEHLKAALGLRNADARAMTNLGNALFAQGDLEGAKTIYETAAAADRTLAAPSYNLARLQVQLAQKLPVEAASMERDQAINTLGIAVSIDRSLEGRAFKSDAPLVPQLVTPPLTRADLLSAANPGALAASLQSQLGLQLVGTAEPWVGAVYPVLLSVAVVWLSRSAFRLRATKACNKCGRPVCSRCDPEVGRGSVMCHQCVNVFARKGVVSPSEKVRKQYEVARHQRRMDKVAYGLGAVCAGAGHLFAGLPVRGALHAYAFLLALTWMFFRDGLLKLPFGELPLLLRLAPAGLLLGVIYLSSLRGLYKRQAG